MSEQDLRALIVRLRGPHGPDHGWQDVKDAAAAADALERLSVDKSQLHDGELAARVRLAEQRVAENGDDLLLPPSEKLRNRLVKERDEFAAALIETASAPELLELTRLERLSVEQPALVCPCVCGHEKGDHQQRIGQRGNYTPCCVVGCQCSGFRKARGDRPGTCGALSAKRSRRQRTRGSRQ